jgi:serine/threonine protein kinase/WD40 repeat protein/tetratricopeptide (TPR) repeat protein
MSAVNEESIFAAALAQQAPAQRVALLDQACAGDTLLRSRVEALLWAHDNPDSALEAPLAGSLATAALMCREGPGTRIGPYQLLEEIGEGGFGIVFLAEQHKPLRRRVALKVIKPGMDTRQVIARFEAERQALALMDHPNIAKVHDGGETAGGRPYFVMELVQGIPITDYCDQAQMAPRQRLDLFVTVCQAVQHAHQKGIIHRDIKPSNVLVTMQDGQPVAKVIDFGIAKATGPQLTDKTLCTGAAQLIGTPLYMSPEQAGPGSVDVDTRSDIYSLGVLLYELLTGTTPFDKERLKKAGYDEICRLIREEEPARPSARLSALGTAAEAVSANRQSDPRRLAQLCRGELDWIVLKALEKDRSRRYETASALAADIERYLNDEPVEACPPSALYRLRKLVRRNRAAVVAAALLAVLAVGSVVSTALIARQLRRAEQAEENLRAERDRAVAAEAEAQKNLHQALHAQREGKQQLWRAKLAQAQANRWSGRAGRYFASMQALREAGRLARSLKVSERNLLKLRNEVIACTALADLRRIPMWERYTPEMAGALFDPLSRRCTTSDDQGSISIHRQSDGQVIFRLQGPGLRVKGASLSPDGRFLAAVYPFDREARQGRILIWDLTHRDLTFELKPKIDWPTVVWSPDSRRFGTFVQARTIAVYDLLSRRKISILTGFRPHLIVFHPNGKQLAVTQGGPDVQICAVETGQQIGRFVFPLNIGCLAWGADGRFLAAAGEWNIYVWDVQAGRMHDVLKGHSNSVTSVAFNHAGDLLASTSWDGTLRLWDPWTAKELLRQEGPIWGNLMGFTPDDRFLWVSWANGWHWWQVRTSRELRTLHQPDNARRIGGGIFSANGRLLVTEDAGGFRLWDLAALRPLAFLPAGDGPACFERTSNSLLTATTAGTFRWPLSFAPDEKGERLRIGPPEKLGWTKRRAISQDERTLAALQQGRVLSPDGRWAATGSWHSDGPKVWDARTGKLVRHLTTEDASVCFSPDDKWLVTGSQKEYVLWEVGSWKRGTKIVRKQGYVGGIMAFSPDSKLLAIGNSRWDLQLIDPRTGRQLATLPNSESASVDYLAFSPDGSQLEIVTHSQELRRGTSRHPELHVLDVRALRRQLGEMGLDWDMPPFPPTPASTPPGQGREGRRPGKPLRVQLELGEFLDRERYSLAIAFSPFNSEAYYRRGLAYARFHQWDQAYADFQMAIALQPDHAEALYQLGLFVAFNKWKAAFADYARVVVTMPARAQYLHALARLGSGDRSGYRRVCAETLERFARTTNAEAANFVAWVCVLGPEAVRDLEEAVRLAARAASADPKNDAYQVTLGAALYRAGRFQEAVQRLEQAVNPKEADPTKVMQYSPAYCWLFLAMAHQRLGHAAEAGRWLDKAVQWIKRQAKEPSNPAEGTWYRRLTLQLLCREAEALLNQPAADQPKRKK